MSNGRVIGLISGKGGVGKTTLSVNLGVALQQMDKEVTVVDADFSASNLGVYLGRYDHPVKIQDVLEDGAEVDAATFRHQSGLTAITSGNEIDQVEPDTSALRDILFEASKDSDYVLVDCPPGLNSNVEEIIKACDELLIVTMPTQTAGINAAQIIERCKELKKPVLGTVLNKVEGRPDKELVEREIEMMTECHVLSEIPYDPEFKESLFENMPLILFNEYNEAVLDIKELAADLEGYRYEPPRFVSIKRKLRWLKKSISR